MKSMRSMRGVKPTSSFRMAIEEGDFRSADGERLFYRFHRASNQKNPLILLHGHGEHSGRYLKFFSRLEDHEIPMGIFDLRGCGQSGGERASVRRFEDYLSDVTCFIRFLTDQFQVRSPVLLFGHSLGGLIALSWARENPSEISKLILSSPLLGMHRESIVKMLAGPLNRLLPDWMVNNPVSPPFLTHDLEEVKRYKSDPLIQRKITIRLVNEMLRYASSFRGIEISFACPVYILMSGKDYVVNPKFTLNFFDQLHAPEKKLKSFPGFYHEIFNEVGQAEAFEELKKILGRP